MSPRPRADTLDRPSPTPPAAARGQGPRLPDVPGPLETLGIAWRRLRRMSTALALLFAMSAASVVATFVPQEPVIASTVADWRDGSAGPGERWAQAFDTLGLFDVFGSWWFLALTALLFVSLTGCLVPRHRAFARTVRRPPVPGRNLERLSNHVVLVTARPPEQVYATAERLLGRYRRRRLEPSPDGAGGDQLAAERGHWREGGSLLFHTAFYVLLVGVLVGQAFGFVGQVNLPEGAVFADTRISYDRAEPGRYFGLEDHRGFEVALDRFEVSYFENFVPREFVSTVTIREAGRPLRTDQVRVNHPLTHDGVKLYQARFGMAPRVVVRAGDNAVFDERVMLSDAGGNVWTGVAKVAVGDPQIALDVVVLPDADVSDEGVPFSRTPEPRNVRLLADLYVAEDLGLHRPEPASRFDRDAAEPLGPVVLAEGMSQELAGLTVEFADLGYWSGFQVSHAPGRGILLASGILLLAGLIPSLYSYRRRVWVEAREADGATRVVVAGAALQRKPRFAEEFAELSGTLRRQLDPPDRTRGER